MRLCTSMCLIADLPARFSIHSQSMLSPISQLSRRQVVVKYSSVSNSLMLDDNIFFGSPLATYTSNESYHRPHTCSMRISAVTMIPPPEGYRMSLLRRKYKATSGQQDFALIAACSAGRSVMPSRDNHCRPALHITMRVARRGRIDYPYH